MVGVVVTVVGPAPTAAVGGTVGAGTVVGGVVGSGDGGPTDGSGAEVGVDSGVGGPNAGEGLGETPADEAIVIVVETSSRVVLVSTVSTKASVSGTGGGGAEPTVAATVTAAAEAIDAAGAVAASRATLSACGSSNTHARGAKVFRSVSDASRRARTTVGSNWVPLHRTSSWRAASCEIGSLYERFEVMTS